MPDYNVENIFCQQIAVYAPTRSLVVYLLYKFFYKQKAYSFISSRKEAATRWHTYNHPLKSNSSYGNVFGYISFQTFKRKYGSQIVELYQF